MRGHARRGRHLAGKRRHLLARTALVPVALVALVTLVPVALVTLGTMALMTLVVALARRMRTLGPRSTVT